VIVLSRAVANTRPTDPLQLNKGTALTYSCALEHSRYPARYTGERIATYFTCCELIRLASEFIRLTFVLLAHSRTLSHTATLHALARALTIVSHLYEVCPGLAGRTALVHIA